MADRSTRMLIISSARTLFSEKGYDETAVEEICSLAGVAKGTFFYYFESKQSIVRYILSIQLEEYRDRLREQMDTLKDAVSKIEYFVSAMMDCSGVCFEPETYFKSETSDWFRTVLNEERLHALYPLLEDTVLEGIRNGFFKVKNPAVCSAIAFLGLDSYLRISRDCGDELREGIKEFTAKALGVKETAFVM